MSFETGKANQLLKILEEHDHEMTFMETRADDIHDFLEDIINYQKQYRLVSATVDEQSHGRPFPFVFFC